MKTTGPRRNGNVSSKKQMRQWRQHQVLEIAQDDMIDDSIDLQTKDHSDKHGRQS